MDKRTKSIELANELMRKARGQAWGLAHHDYVNGYRPDDCPFEDATLRAAWFEGYSRGCYGTNGFPDDPKDQKK